MSETVGEILASMVAPAPRSSTRAQCPKCLAEVACETLEFEHGKQIITQTTFAAHGACGRHTAHGYRDRPGFEDATTTKGMPKAREPQERLCPCGKTFGVLHKQSPQKFCGRDCTAKGRTHVKKCEWCERQFEPMKAKVRFCSKRCAALHNNDARGAQTEEERGQPLGEPATPPPSQEPAEEVAMQPESEWIAIEETQDDGPNLERTRQEMLERLHKRPHFDDLVGFPERLVNSLLAWLECYERTEVLARNLQRQNEFLSTKNEFLSTSLDDQIAVSTSREAQIEDLQSKLVEAECEVKRVCALNSEVIDQRIEWGEKAKKAEAEAERLRAELAKAREPQAMPPEWIPVEAGLARPHRLAGYLAEKVPAKLLFAAAGLAKCLEQEPA